MLPSLFEGFGNVLVEALAMGCPVVSTDCPTGPTEILEGGKWGTLVSVGDYEAMAVAILEKLDIDRKDKSSLLNSYLERFELEEILSQYLDMIIPEIMIEEKLCQLKRRRGLYPHWNKYLLIKLLGTPLTFNVFVKLMEYTHL